MVRINLINPRNLTDQHLMAEYYELLMLISYARKHPDTKGIPKEFCLGKGHIRFFKNKLGYLKQRHKKIKKEMTRRGFKNRLSVNLKGCRKCLIRGWRPKEKDLKKIRKRLAYKIRLKPKYYRYCGEHKSLKEFIRLINR